MATQKLNLTRDQLATFLKNNEQIKQFESLFALADSIAPDLVQAAAIQAGNADAAANEALAQIVRLAQDAAINSGAADQKAVQALDTLGRIANALEMLATRDAKSDTGGMNALVEQLRIQNEQQAEQLRRQNQIVEMLLVERQPAKPEAAKPEARSEPKKKAD